MPVKVLSETDIQAQILRYLELRGVFAWRNNTRVLRVGGRLVRFGAPGSPDIIGCLPGKDYYRHGHGRFLAIEVKRPGKVPSKEQTDFLERLRSLGALVIVADDVQTVIDHLEPVMSGRPGPEARQGATPRGHAGPPP